MDQTPLIPNKPKPFRQKPKDKVESKQDSLPVEALLQEAGDVKSKFSTTTWFDYKLSDGQIEDYSAMAGCNIKIARDAKAHTHPLLALERLLCMNFIFARNAKWKIQGIVYDIGASMNQHVGRDFVRGLCPLKTPSDVYRNKVARQRNPAARFCTHTMQDATIGICTCHAGPPVAGAISIHSLYYLPPADIAAFLVKHQCNLHAVLHHFDGPEGGFNEMVYWREGDVVVARTPSETYEHNPMDWLRIPGNAVDTPAGTLGWHHSWTCGHTHVYEFFISPVPAPEIHISMSLALTNPNTYGQVDLGLFAEENARIETQFSEITEYLPINVFSLGEYFDITTRSQVVVTVPKNAFHELLYRIAGTPRNPGSFITHLATTKKILLAYRMSAQMRSKIVMPVAVFSFFWNVDAEEQVMTSALRRWGHTLFDHAQALAFKVTRFFNWKRIAAVTIPTVAGIIYAIRRWRAQRAASGYVEMPWISYIMSWVPYSLPDTLWRARRLIQETQTESDSIWSDLIDMFHEFPWVVGAFMGQVVLIEELIKWVVPYADHAMVILEYVSAALKFGPQAAVVLRAPMTFIHYMWRVNKPFGFILHWVWNMFLIQQSMRHFGAGLVPKWSLIIMALLGTIWYLYVRKDSTYTEFMRNYRDGRGTSMAAGMFPVARPIYLPTTTAKTTDPPVHANVKIDMTRTKYTDTENKVGMVWGVPQFPPVVFSANTNNEYSAVARAYQPTVFDPDLIPPIEASHIRKWFTSIGTPVVISPARITLPIRNIVNAPNWTTWIARYPQFKRVELELSADKINTGLFPNNTIDSFTKIEKLSIMDPDGTKDKIPRMINGTSKDNNALLGPWANDVAKQLCAALNPSGQIHLMLDGDVVGLCKAVQEFDGDDVYWVEADVSKMDGSYVPEGLQLIYEFYRNIGLPEKLVNYLSTSRAKRNCYSRHGVSFVLRHKRASGESDTGLGNTIEDLIIFLLAWERYHEANKVPILGVLFCCLGDDHLIGLRVRKGPPADIDEIPKSAVDQFVAIWTKSAKQYGFDLDIEIHQELMRASYLSCAFWPIPPTTYDLPNYYPADDHRERRVTLHRLLGVLPGRWLLRAGWVILDRPCEDHSRQICRDSILSMEFMLMHVPIVRHFAIYINQFLGDIKTKTTMYKDYEQAADWRKLEIRPVRLPCHHPTDFKQLCAEGDLQSLSARYRIDPDLIVDFYRTILMKLHDWVEEHQGEFWQLFISHPLLDAMKEFDL